MPDRDKQKSNTLFMDPHSLQEQLLHPHESFTALRKDVPIYNAEAKLWEVYAYEDVHYIATENELFSSDDAKFLPEQEQQALKSILNTDPPRHRQLRSLVTQAFTPRAIAQLAPRIASITHELLNAVLAQGTMDVVTDLSYPFPIIVIAEMLGVPIADRPQFKRWSDALVTAEYDDYKDDANIESIRHKMRARVRVTMDEMTDYFRQIIAERRHKPDQNLISGLLEAQIDGEYLTEQEVLGFCVLLLVAGNITTTNLIGNAFLCFDEHPEVMEHLRARPDLMPSAIEEVLRYRSPVTALGRFATADVTLQDQNIQRGQFIVTWISCANHDPAQFPHPELFDIERSPNRHVAFGHGIHFCLGAPLARLEARIALNIMLERMHSIRRARDLELEPINSAFIYGARHVPITFSPS